jgi:outer membrane protein assembly factor BamB
MTGNVIPSPVSGFGLLYAISGFRGAALRAIRYADAKGDVTDSDKIAWKYDKDTPYVPSPLLYEDTLYFLENNKAILTCLNAKTGEPFYTKQRLEGVEGIYASPIGAAGRVYVAGRDGTVVVLERGGEFKVLATNQLDDGFDASPVAVDGELYLRGHKRLYCITRQ